MIETIRSERLDLVGLSPGSIAALLDGPRNALGYAVPDEWPDEHEELEFALEPVA